jgi:HAMP domain-containing protein
VELTIAAPLPASTTQLEAALASVLQLTSTSQLHEFRVTSLSSTAYVASFKVLQASATAAPPASALSRLTEAVASGELRAVVPAFTELQTGMCELSTELAPANGVSTVWISGLSNCTLVEAAGTGPAAVTGGATGGGSWAVLASGSFELECGAPGTVPIVAVCNGVRRTCPAIFCGGEGLCLCVCLYV